MPIDKDLKDSILRDISLTGAASEENKIVETHLSGTLSNILDFSSGRPRIKSHLASKFQLILDTPNFLKSFNPFELRCCLCKKVIQYPAWYHSVRFTIKQFHYLICFDRFSPDKPTTKCYRS